MNLIVRRIRGRREEHNALLIWRDMWVEESEMHRVAAANWRDELQQVEADRDRERMAKEALLATIEGTSGLT